MSQWLVEWIRYSGTYGDLDNEAYVVEMEDEEATKIHEEVGRRMGEDLIVNPVEVTSYADLRKLVGLR